MNIQAVRRHIDESIDVINKDIEKYSDVFETGEYYIVKQKDEDVIVEYNGNELVCIDYDINLPPKYMYVAKPNKTIIYYNKTIYNCSKWFICVDCKKITLNKMKIVTEKENNTIEACVHCFFLAVYNNGEYEKYNGIPMPVGLYIKRYMNVHRMEQCKNKDGCFICLFKQNKINLSIDDLKYIYGENILQFLEKNTVKLFI